MVTQSQTRYVEIAKLLKVASRLDIVKRIHRMHCRHTEFTERNLWWISACLWHHQIIWIILLLLRMHAQFYQFIWGTNSAYNNRFKLLEYSRAKLFIWNTSYLSNCIRL